MDLKLALDKYVSSSSEVLGGARVFKGTRVPLKILFDYLLGGDTIEDFLENYPTVDKTSVQSVLELLGVYLSENPSNNETAA
ncbi:DUF433 domain-containing protein [Sediminicola luteus]|uniref:DUF433 domain-containing protein n=1 Tax=Sediminicola luteus TaxID=319238 RepID=A0A2A4G6I9_9FLAO|nr:DUF433 domain-containing protein [Sediminicola luteus]PCE64051.1 hypothetical protein B7P33_12470 [Sediminicola luteus]